LKATNWKDIAELVGIAAIVASLIFVGLQMQQTQKIALAAAYQARADTSIGIFQSISESDELISTWTKINQSMFSATYDDAGIDFSNQLTPREKTVAIAFFFQRLTYLENMYFQYRNGFVSEEQWQSNINDLRFDLSIGINRVFWDEFEGATLTQSFKDIVDDVRRELDEAAN